MYFLADETKDPGTGRLLHRPRFAPEDDWVVGPHPFAAGSNQTYSTVALGYEGADLASKVGAAGVEGPCHIHIVIRPDDDAKSGGCAGVGLVLVRVGAQPSLREMDSAHSRRSWSSINQSIYVTANHYHIRRGQHEPEGPGRDVADHGFGH